MWHFSPVWSFLPACLRELWSTIVSLPHNAEGHVIVQGFQDTEGNFEKRHVMCCGQARAPSVPQMRLVEALWALTLSSPLQRQAERGRLLCKMHKMCHWYWNHCLKRHSLLSELPTAWNEESLVRIIHLCRNLGSVKKHLSMEIVTFIMNDSCNK